MTPARMLVRGALTSRCPSWPTLGDHGGSKTTTTNNAPAQLVDLPKVLLQDAIRRENLSAAWDSARQGWVGCPVLLKRLPSVKGLAAHPANGVAVIHVDIPMVMAPER